MNSATAKSFYDSFTPEEKAQAKALKAQGLDPMTAIKQVHAAKLGGVLADAAPDIAAAESNPTTGENIAAFGSGAARTLGLGLDDEVAGIAKAVGSQMMGGGFSLDRAKQAYTEGRDAQREANAAIDTMAPAAAGGGKLAAELGSVLLPGGKAVSTAKALPSLGRAVLQGAGLGGATGAVAGFGQDEGPVAANVIKGGVLGSLAGGALGGVSSLANPQTRANIAADVRDYGAAAKARVKPLDVVGEIPIVGKPIKAAGQQFQAVAADVAAARAKRPVGGAPDILDPAISDDFVNPEVIDMASPSTPSAALESLPTTPEMAQLPEGTKRWLGEGQKRLTAGEPMPGVADDLEGLTEAVSARQAEPVPPPEPMSVEPDVAPADDMQSLVDAVQPMPSTPAAEAPDPLAAMRGERAQDWGTSPSSANRPAWGAPLPDPSLAEGIAAGNTRAKVTPVTMRQTNAAQGNPSVKTPGTPTTKGDWASVLKAATPAQRAEILRNLRINNGKSFASDVAKMAGVTNSSFDASR